MSALSRQPLGKALTRPVTVMLAAIVLVSLVVIVSVLLNTEIASLWLSLLSPSTPRI